MVRNLSESHSKYQEIYLIQYKSLPKIIPKVELNCLKLIRRYWELKCTLRGFIEDECVNRSTWVRGL
jgi:hypothetical protein